MSKQTPKVVIPRKLEEIKTEYNQFRLRVADAQYQVFVYTKELENLNHHMLRLNQEAEQRNELDRQSAADAEKASSEAEAKPESQSESQPSQEA